MLKRVPTDHFSALGMGLEWRVHCESMLSGKNHFVFYVSNLSKQLWVSQHAVLHTRLCEP